MWYIYILWGEPWCPAKTFPQEMQDLEAIVRSLMEDQGKLAVTCIDSQRPPGTTTGTTGSAAGPGGPGAPYDAPAPPPPPVGAPLTQPIPVVLNLLKLGFNLVVGQRWPLFCHSCWWKWWNHWATFPQFQGVHPVVAFASICRCVGHCFCTFSWQMIWVSSVVSRQPNKTSRSFLTFIRT